jgi:hypothetical protein
MAADDAHWLAQVAAYIRGRDSLPVSIAVFDEQAADPSMATAAATADGCKE